MTLELTQDGKSHKVYDKTLGATCEVAGVPDSADAKVKSTMEGGGMVLMASLWTSDDNLYWLNGGARRGPRSVTAAGAGTRPALDRRRLRRMVGLTSAGFSFRGAGMNGGPKCAGSCPPSRRLLVCVAVSGVGDAEKRSHPPCVRPPSLRPTESIADRDAWWPCSSGVAASRRGARIRRVARPQSPWLRAGLFGDAIRLRERAQALSDRIG